ncbi:conserved hypothetical protein [Microsporum canis CBS 113480]|uniref:Uncharacterized protein n=1 Tax=Arthroderma otae (strain ATCC MYA-4605 / CBS 113480) TaxID=554155 RepID=C5FIS8_ARTOC|nr:conserved hypothetical protein [Microsporum canis CBS 113480]EEQ29169.1 conserved hypothetical protein [Microsporum canis CBS 113480]
MFSFPAQLESDQQPRNWYQDLLDHPDCQGDPVKVQQAYESYRHGSLTRSLTSLTQADGKPKITPSPALVQYLSYVVNDTTPKEVENHYRDENLNYMWFPEPSRLHLSVIEISHRHPMAHLRSVFDQIGKSLFQKLLDHPATLAATESRTSRLGRPMLLFDGVGVAISFVPVGTDQYTYHHLRADLHNMAVSSGIKTDTCYTACMSHITLGRFVSSKNFDLETAEMAQQRLRDWINTIQSINKELNEYYQANDWEWTVGEEKGLELQMGMLKFGRDTDAAEMAGRCFGDEAMPSMTAN